MHKVRVVNGWNSSTIQTKTRRSIMIHGEKPRLYYETVKLVRHWVRLPRAVQ